MATPGQGLILFAIIVRIRKLMTPYRKRLCTGRVGSFAYGLRNSGCSLAVSIAMAPLLIIGSGNSNRSPERPARSAAARGGAQAPNLNSTSAVPVTHCVIGS